ncbi:hypothetical protein PM082_006556 [Marasmius tenuissimus]|nr:hypothetical protein PM082_006556 [Marasmius tenuissimus]
MTYHEKEGTSKLHGMLQFAQDLRTCRKLQFANYFSHSSQLSINSWSTEEESAHQKCGHCDNCTRPPDDIEERDVTLQTWQILKILRDVLESGGSVTATMLAGLVRGTGGAAFNVAGGGKGKRKATPTKASVDLGKVCGGKVDMKKDEIEFLLVELILQQFLAESPQVTPYHTVMYMKLGRRAPQVDRLSRADVENGNVTPVKVWFKTTKKASKAKAKEKEKESGKPRRSSSGTGKRGRPRKNVAAEDDTIVDGDDEGKSIEDLSCEVEVRLDSDIDDQDEDDEYDQTVLATASRRASVRRSMSSRDDNNDIEEEDSDGPEGNGDGWMSSFRQGPPRKRLKQALATTSNSIATRSRSKAPPSRRASLSPSPDIIEISSD